MNIFFRTGLFTAILLATLVSGCTSISTDGPLATDDTAIERNVQERLAFDGITAPENISVMVEDGRVTLNGSVRTEAVRFRAIGIARSTPGVTEVVDKL
jgi:osmotically-inducible protein OsmY